MNGSNSLDELRRHPLHCCPVELHKLKRALPHMNLETRYRALSEVYGQRADVFADEARWVAARLAGLPAAEAGAATAAAAASGDDS